jgi:hypothetical protein
MCLHVACAYVPPHLPLPHAGVSKQLDGGALAKIKLENSGIVSVLYEQVWDKTPSLLVCLLLCLVAY